MRDLGRVARPDQHRLGRERPACGDPEVGLLQPEGRPVRIERVPVVEVVVEPPVQERLDGVPGREGRNDAELVADLLAKQPLLSAVTPPEDAVFLPVALTTEDGHKLLELVIVSLEAQRKDWLESLKFDLRLDSEALWLLPARSDSDGWSLLIKGV